MISHVDDLPPQGPAGLGDQPAMVAAFLTLANTTGDKMEGNMIVILTNEGWADSREKS